MKKPMTYERARELLGDVDYLTLSRILATGASENDIERALYEVELGDEHGEQLPGSGGGTIAEVSAILRELREQELERLYETATD